MNKKVFMDFVDMFGEACYVDAYAIQAIMKGTSEGRVTHAVILLDYGHEIDVEGEPAAVLERVVKVALDDYHLSKFGFIPGEQQKGGGRHGQIQ